MARTSYLMRREGRYYVQARLARHVAMVAGRKLYRASLRTADYRQARHRLVECMTWIHRMNDTIDYVSLFEKNALQLRQYLADAWPVSAERLVGRRNYEELLKNMVRRARSVGCDPTMVEPDFQALLNHFVRQNVDAEIWLRKIENQHHYERGRADVEAGLGSDPLRRVFDRRGPRLLLLLRATSSIASGAPQLHRRTTRHKMRLPTTCFTRNARPGRTEASGASWPRRSPLSPTVGYCSRPTPHRAPCACRRRLHNTSTTMWLGRARRTRARSCR